MQTPVRYYITKDHDQPVVRTVPVAVATAPRPAAAPRTGDVVTDHQTDPTRRRVTRLVRAAVRRSSHDLAV